MVNIMPTGKKIAVLSFLTLTFISFSMYQCGISFRKSGDTPGAAEELRQTAMTEMPIKLGIDVLIEKRLDLVVGKRVGLITNPSGVNREMVPTVTVLFNNKDVNLTKLFGPEHGIRGDVPAGEYVTNYRDDKTSLPVYSLYGSTRRPTQEMLENLDVLIFDIQDLGVRPYTYIYTMAYAMEAAAEYDIEFIVLDRPNPLGGNLVDGNILEPEFKSFIGLYPIPYVHGMTVGEIAWFFNSEFGINADLKVVPMEGWNRSTTFNKTGLNWVPTSPHIPLAETVPYYATTGLIGELGTISVGVGYTMPFMLTGNPDIDAFELADELNMRKLPGVIFRPMHWRQFYGAFKDKQVGGVQIVVSDMAVYMPYSTGIHILGAIKKLYPDKDYFPDDRSSGFNRASGTSTIFKRLKAGVPSDVIVASYQAELGAFMELRAGYLLYR